MNIWKRQLLFILLLVVQMPAQAGIDIHLLMQNLAQAEHPPRHYTETRESSLLIAPIISNGTLHFKDGVLIKQINEPFSERFVIKEQSLIIKQGSGSKEIALSDYPPLAGFVTIFRSTLQGDLETLNNFFKVDISGTSEKWQIKLKPITDTLSPYLNRVTISGKQQRIEQFDIQERSGDLTTIILGKDVQ